MKWFRVWYMKPEFWRHGNFGFDYLKGKGELPNPKRLSETHTYVLPVLAASKAHLYSKMQGEVWSPNGEARWLIRNLGLEHTSMSVGDIMVDEDGKVWMVDRFGFAELTAPEEIRA